MRKIFVSFLCLVVVFSVLGLTSAKKTFAADQTDLISVKLVNFIGNKKVIDLQLNGDYLVEGYGSQLLAGSYEVKIESGRLVLYKDSTKLLETSLTIKMYPVAYNSSHYISMSGLDYLGQMDFTMENGYIRPINTLPLVDYLKGVVPSESYASWGIEALKAQAVAARGYAIGKIGSTIYDSQNSQVYKGYYRGSTYNNSNKAVEATKGEVLKYGNSIITPLYSSSNGGMILSDTNTWGNPSTWNPYYLKKSDPYDLLSGSPYKKWSYSFQKVQFSGVDLKNPDAWWSKTTEADSSFISNLEAKLKRDGTVSKDYDMKIVEINGVDFNSIGGNFSSNTVLSGDITFSYYLKNTTTNSYRVENGALKKYNYTFSDESYNIRSLVGVTVMRSPYITDVVSKSTEFVVNGAGFGHGIGMSQWGASEMANQGKSYKEILAFYYPGIDVVKAVAEPQTVDLVDVQTDLQSPQRLGKGISINAEANGGRELLYRFWVSDGTDWKMIQDYSTKSTTTWNPSKSGNFTISVHVKDKYSGNEYDDYKAFEYQIDEGVKITSVELDKKSPQNINTPVTIKVNATGGTTRLFEFSVYDGNEWSVIREYSTSNVFTWTPTKAGNYKFSIHAKDESSTKEYDDYSVFYYDIVSEPVTMTGVTTSLTSPQVTDTTVNIVANATGGSDKLYRFWIYDGKIWSALTNYTTENEYAWKPTTPGDYKFSVYVKDRSSDKTYDDYGAFTYKIVAKPKIKELVISKPSSQPTGTPIKIQANAVGGVNNLYEFWVGDGTEWKLLKEYSASNEFEWVPEKAGNYRITVHVKDQNSSHDYDGYAYVDYNIVAKLATISGVTLDKTSPQGPNSVINITANGTGENEPQYKFFVFDGKEWKVLQDYSATNTLSWKPTTPGKYKFSIHIKDKYSTNAYDDYYAFEYEIVASPVMKSLETDIVSPSKAGTAVNIVANAVGGTEKLYKFWLYDGTTWEVLQDYSPSNTYKWVPTTSGNYKITVHVKDVNSTRDYDDYAAIYHLVN